MIFFRDLAAVSLQGKQASVALVKRMCGTMIAAEATSIISDKEDARDDDEPKTKKRWVRR